MNKFEEFQQNYEKSVATIKRFLNPDLTQTPQMHKLVQWMLETDANPYAYLPETWASALGSAQGFANLLYHIHHAIYDDGDICFVAVNAEPRIVFAHPSDQDFRERVLSEQEKQLAKTKVFGREQSYTIEVLAIEPNEFGELYDAYYLADLQRCFSTDAARFGIDFAVEHYNHYQLFSEDWPETCAEQIAKWEKFYQKTKGTT